MVNYWKTFYDLHTALNTSCSELRYTSKMMPLETEDIEKNENRSPGLTETLHDIIYDGIISK